MSVQTLARDYPWTTGPLIVGAPMYPFSLSPLATAVSLSGGLGFIAAGTTTSTLPAELSRAAELLNRPPASTLPLPIGIGFINWGADLDSAIEVIRDFVPAAVWLFAPKQIGDLAVWAERVREAAGGRTKVWVQIGSVKQALEVAELCKPDVIVVQGADAGGHGLAGAAGIISLLPEVSDALTRTGHTHIPLIAAGGLTTSRTLAAALCLGASGCALGTRFLACHEANIPPGYLNTVLSTTDGGTSTVRTQVFDNLCGLPWPSEYDGRGIRNRSFADAEKGMGIEENQRLGEKEGGRGPEGRTIEWVGTGVGLVTEVKGAGEIVEEVRGGVKGVLEETMGRF
ncbi:MAG: hypothetical protein M1839_005535 [Geoglossum umbratile]|nr:MAG: hypothetical protein M1839_005535 [Geoglossum umbratile]